MRSNYRKNDKLNEAITKIDLLGYILRTAGGKVVMTASDRSGDYHRIDPCPICGHKGHFDVYKDSKSYCSRSGCCKGGTIIDFFQEYEGTDLENAIKLAKKEAGITDDNSFNQSTAEEDFKEKDIEELQGDKKNLPDFTSLIEELHKNVKDTEYYKNRGLTFTIDKYKLGYHPRGLNYAADMSNGLIAEKRTDLTKTYKYFIPCINKDGVCNYFVTRRDDTEPIPSWVKSKVHKIHNLKGRSVEIFNNRYIEDPSTCDQFIFVVEGWADALSIEEVGYNAIAINSANNTNNFIKLVKKNKDLLKKKIFILSGDNDTAGNKMNTNLKNDLTKLKMQCDTYIIPHEGDFNHFLVSDKKGLINSLKDFLSNVTVKEIVDDKITAFEFGSSVFEQDNCYFKYQKESTKIISNFILEPTELIENEKASELKANIKTASGMRISRTFLIEDFNSTAKFKRTLNSIDLSYTGKDEELEYIKAKISQMPFARKKGVISTGFHHINDKWIFVSGNKTLDDKLNAVEDIVLLNSYKELDTDLLDHEAIKAEELIKITEALFKFNTLKKTATILGYAAGLFLKEKLWHVNIKYNHLLLIGEAGSGKSHTAENVIMPILGVTTPAIGASKVTTFSSLKTASSSNTIPFVIDEYKPHEMKEQQIKDISNLLRDVYDHHRGLRGRPDQTIEYYDLCSPVIIIGEMGFDETAVTERSLQIIFSKMDIEGEEKQAYIEILKNNSELLKKFGKSLLEASLSMDPKELKKLHEACLKSINPKITLPRVKNSIANCMLGISIIKKVYSNLNLDIQELTDISIKNIIEAISEAAFDDLLDSSNSSRTIIDNTLEVFARMANAGELYEDYDYKIVNKDQLALNISRIYDRYLKYRNTCRLQDEYLSQKQFTSQLRRTNYYVEYKAVKLCTDLSRMNKKNERCYVLSIPKLRGKELELESLIGFEDDFDNLVEVNDGIDAPFA